MHCTCMCGFFFAHENSEKNVKHHFLIWWNYTVTVNSYTSCTDQHIPQYSKKKNRCLFYIATKEIQQKVGVCFKSVFFLWWNHNMNKYQGNYINIKVESTFVELEEFGHYWVSSNSREAIVPNNNNQSAIRVGLKTPPQTLAGRWRGFFKLRMTEKQTSPQCVQITMSVISSHRTHKMSLTRVLQQPQVEAQWYYWIYNVLQCCKM